MKAAEAACYAPRRLNWQLHFGEAPKWAAGVKFLLVDPAATPRDADMAAVVLAGDAGAVAQQLAEAAAGALVPARFAAWRAAIAAEVCPAPGHLPFRHTNCPSSAELLTPPRILHDLLHLGGAALTSCLLRHAWTAGWRWAAQPPQLNQVE